MRQDHTLSPTRPRTLALFWGLLIIVNLFMAFGAVRVRFDDGLGEVFKSTGPVYSAYQSFLSDFRVSEGDVLMVFTGGDFAEPENYAAIREFVFEVQFEPEIVGLVSPFSFDLPPADSAGLKARLAALHDSNPALRRFLSADRQVVAIALIADHSNQGRNTGPLSQRIMRIARDAIANISLKARLTGYPALRDSVVAAVFGDFLLNTVIGITIGTILSILALRSVALALMATGSSATALLWMLGLFGYAGLSINVVTLSLPVLILVLSFASAIHLTIEVRRRTMAGASGAVSSAVRRIGPAVLLTTITTAAAFASLMTSPSALISDMGRSGVIATLASLAAVFAMQPLLLASAGLRPGLARLFAGNRGQVAEFLRLAPLYRLAARWPGAVSALSGLLLVAAVATYMQVVPQYSLYDHVATDSDAFQALREVETSLAPIGSIAFPTSIALDTPAGLEQLRQAEKVLKAHAGALEVVSILPFLDQGDGTLASLPDILRSRLISREGNNPILLVLVPNRGARSVLGAVAVRDMVDKLTFALESDPEWPADKVAAPTGLLVASSYLSRDMLLDLNRCFLVAVIASGLVVAIWLRNPVIGLLALIPNVLPVALVGAWLTLSGAGLEFASGIALTIAFGLAIDDTVHVLNRLRLDAPPDGRLSRELIKSALARVSPALVITSGVLSFGLIGTQVGQLPLISYFGRLSIAAFILALIADLLVLPAILIVAQKYLPERLMRIRT